LLRLLSSRFLDDNPKDDLLSKMKQGMKKLAVKESQLELVEILKEFA